MKSVLLIITIFSLNYLIYAQNSNLTPILYPYKSPKSPNASSFEKYLEIPTDLNSGQISFSVPIYNIGLGEIAVPISLEYQNSGLKVADIPSWVGLGWNLIAGGAITRTVKGLPDDCPQGLLNEGQKVKLNEAFSNQLSGMQRYMYFREIALGETDSEHDIFNYEFCGQRGSFYIDGNNVCKQLPNGNNKIIFTRANDGLINSFEITDLKGTRYLFNIREDAITDADNSIYNNFFYDRNVGSTWYLSKITSVTNRIIDFEYNQYQVVYRNYVESQTIARSSDGSLSQCAVPANSYTSAGMTIYTPSYQIKRISWDLGKIDFIPGSTRLDMKDLDPQNNIPSLSKIQLSNSSNILYKEFELNTIQLPRLLLRNILFRDITLGTISQKYEFNYYQETLIPSCNRNLGSFKGQDFWGYYNGANQNSLLSYNLLPFYMTNIWGLNTYTSANRNVNPDMAIVGMLKEVIYPTGGKTSFEYESNKVFYKKYNDVPLLFRPSLLAAATYQTIFAGQASTNGSSITNHTGSGSFTIAAEIQGARIRTYESNNDPTGFATTSASITQFPPTFNNSYNNGFCTSSLSSNPYTYSTECIKDLPIGHYYATVTASSFDGYMANSLLTVEKLVVSDNISINVGGLRIKKIINVDPIAQNSVVKVFEYPIDEVNLGNNPILRNVPEFISSVGRNVVQYSSGWYSCGECPNNELFTLHSQSIIPSPGYHIEYPLVIEKVDDNGSLGKIEYFYTSAELIGAYRNKPYAEPAFLNWKGGKPFKQHKYIKEINNTFSLVEENYQDFSGEQFNNWNGFDQNLKVGIKFLENCPDIPGYPSTVVPNSNFDGLSAIDKSFAIEFVPVYTESFVSKFTRKITYGMLPFSNIENNSNIIYNGSNKLLPSEIYTTNSKQRLKKIIHKYPQDYILPNSSVLDDFSKGISVLIQNNIIDIPVESYELGQDPNGNYIVLSAQLLKINPLKPVIDAIYQIEINQPLPLNQFTHSTIDPNGIFIKDSRYQIKTIYSNYSLENNLLEYREQLNISTSIIWDYNNLFPIAEVKNASYSQIAATSFEAGGKGNWTFTGTPHLALSSDLPPTGKKYYNLTPSTVLSKSGLTTSEKYMISYWTKSASPLSVAGTIGTPISTASINGWKYFEHTVTGQTTIIISGTAAIDEVRLYPAYAQMTTFTYDPLIGITSQSDVNGRISYYEYDPFNRLLHQKDQYKNIIKKYCYNHAGQPIQCYD